MRHSGGVKQIIRHGARPLSAFIQQIARSKHSNARYVLFKCVLHIRMINRKELGEEHRLTFELNIHIELGWGLPFASRLGCTPINDVCFCDLGFKARLTYLQGRYIHVQEAFSYDPDCVALKIPLEFDKPSIVSELLNAFQVAMRQVSCHLPQHVSSYMSSSESQISANFYHYNCVKTDKCTFAMNKVPLIMHIYALWKLQECLCNNKAGYHWKYKNTQLHFQNDHKYILTCCNPSRSCSA